MGVDVAEQLVADAETKGEVSFENAPTGMPGNHGIISNETPESTGTEQPKPEDKQVDQAGGVKTETQKAEDYMVKAMEHARLELKEKTDLTDDQIKNYIAQRFLSAAKYIAKIREGQKKVEGEKGEIEKERDTFKRYHEEMEANTLIQAIRKNMVKIVPLAQAGEPENGEELTPEQQELRQLRAEVTRQYQELSTILKGQQQNTAAERQRMVQEQESTKINKAIESEHKLLCDKYPQFKAWYDQFVQTGVPAMEMEELVERATKDGVPLRYVVAEYFSDKGLPSVIKATEKSVVDRLQRKGKEKSETSTTLDPPPAAIRYGDTRSIAAKLVDDGLAKLNLGG